MAKAVYVGVGSKARKMKKAYIGIGGKARKVKKCTSVSEARRGCATVQRLTNLAWQHR